MCFTFKVDSLAIKLLIFGIDFTLPTHITLASFYSPHVFLKKASFFFLIEDKKEHKRIFTSDQRLFS